MFEAVFSPVLPLILTLLHRHRGFWARQDFLLKSLSAVLMLHLPRIVSSAYVTGREPIS